MKNALLSLIALIPTFLSAQQVFEIDEEEYQYMDKLALKFAPDGYSGKSSNHHNYTEIYSYYFASIKDRPLKFLEIGIFEGAGAHFWEEYFKNAELNFIDITFNRVKYSSPRCHYYLADQAKPDQLIDVLKTIGGGQFDIIIDDGGHTMVQQITSFKTLFPYLKSRGLYVIEDLHTSYWPIYGGSRTKSSDTAIEFLKDLIDEVNFVGSTTPNASHRKDLTPIRQELNIYREEILGIHFYDSLCFIIKR